MQNSCTPPMQNQPIYFWVGTDTVGPTDYKAKWLCLFIIALQHSFHWIAMLNRCYFNAEMYIQMHRPTQWLNLTVHPSFLIKTYSLIWASSPPFSLVYTSNHPVTLGSSLFLFPLFLPIVQLPQALDSSHTLWFLSLLFLASSFGKRIVCWALVLASGYHGNSGVFFGFPEI